MTVRELDVNMLCVSLRDIAKATEQVTGTTAKGKDWLGERERGRDN